jgi:hypothetical protein
MRKDWPVNRQKKGAGSTARGLPEFSTNLLYLSLNDGRPLFPSGDDSAATEMVSRICRSAVVVGNTQKKNP